MSSSRNKQNISQLLMNDSFIAWLMGVASDTENARWQRWVSEDPYNETLYREIKALWQGAQFPPLAAQDVDLEWQKLEGRLNLSAAETGSDLSPKKASPGRYRLWWLSVAAAVTLLCGLFAWQLYTSYWSPPSPAWKTIATVTGERARILLPDQSVVMINANSEIQYPEQWDSAPTRSIQLKGEAHFSVTHSTATIPKAFEVITQDGIVTVTGTEFVVYDRGDGTRVQLTRGAVNIEVLNQQPGRNALSGSISLTPGQTVFFHRGDTRLAPARIAPVSWWGDNFLLNETPLHRFLTHLQETYGVTFTINKPGLLDRKLSGAIENHDFNVILETLRLLLQVDITRQGNQVYIGKKPL